MNAKNERANLLGELPLRDDLRGKTPYGAPQLNVPVMLNTNENTHPVPGVVQQEIVHEVSRIAAGLNRYPDRDSHELREKLAGYLGWGLKAKNLWVANGSNEILQQLMQAFGGPGRSVLSFVPTYSMYSILAAGTNTDFIAGERRADFTLSADSAAAQVAHHKPALVILCSPNNPTGTALGADVIEAVYRASEFSRSIVIVDEAYAEFSRDPRSTALAMLPERPRLVVTRTMSKAFALAGARVGYFAAAHQVVDAIQLVRLPYHLSAVSQATALAALRCSEALLANVESIKRQRDRIVCELKNMGLSPAESDSNFVFFGGDFEAPILWQKLVDKGVLVRDVGIEGHLRVTAGTEWETTQFLEAIKNCLAEIV